MIVSRSVTLADPLARANVVEALGGPGGPAGVLELREDEHTLTVRFDDAITAPDLIAIESIFVAAKTTRDLALEEAAAIAAAGLGDPELDESRVIEAYLS